jgi:hypothetical protein
MRIERHDQRICIGNESWKNQLIVFGLWPQPVHHAEWTSVQPRPASFTLTHLNRGEKGIPLSEQRCTTRFSSVSCYIEPSLKTWLLHTISPRTDASLKEKFSKHRVLLPLRLMGACS